MIKIVQAFILDDMVFSYSRIETFDRCGLCFYLQYIKCLDSANSCFGQYGTITHTCLEKYAKGELAEYELLSEYKNKYNEVVTEPFPPNDYVDLGDKYYNQGIDYFSNFEGFEDKILGVEQQYDFKIGKYNFTGVIDLEFPNRILDHKTKREQHLNRLTKKHNKNEFVKMLDGRFIHMDNFKQLYLYCIPYKEKHGKYPEYLSLNMVRINDFYTVKFNQEHFEHAYQWAINKIEGIYNTKEFTKGKDVTNFWCSFVCSQKYNCKYSDRYLGVDA